MNRRKYISGWQKPLYTPLDFLKGRLYGYFRHNGHDFMEVRIGEIIYLDGVVWTEVVSEYHDSEWCKFEDIHKIVSGYVV